jgi:hypothetical protein
MKSENKSIASSIKKSFRKSLKNSKSQERSESFKSNNFVKLEPQSEIEPLEENFDHLVVRPDFGLKKLK